MDRLARHLKHCILSRKPGERKKRTRKFRGRVKSLDERDDERKSCGAGDVRVGRGGQRIGRALVEGELAACVNILRAPVESIYRWKGKVDTANEFLLIIRRRGLDSRAVEEAVKRLHSYEVPEIIALPIERGSAEYLAWLSESVRGAKERRKAGFAAGGSEGVAGLFAGNGERSLHFGRDDNER